MKILNDYKIISVNEKKMLKRCCDAIREIEHSATIVLYGSRARGDALSDSDYDLLIITNEEVSLKREDVFRRQLFLFELESGQVLTVILISRKDWESSLYNAMPFYQNIKREGVFCER